MPSVVDRLTDTSKYTGSHANRFDEDGQGKGQAGRENVVNHDGNTNVAQRGGVVQKDGTKKKKSPITKKYDGQKFGSQADMPRKIKVFSWANENDPGQTVVLNFAIKSFEQLMSKLPNQVTGKPASLISQDLKTRVKKLDLLRDGGQYIAVLQGFKVKDCKPDTKGFPKNIEVIERKGDWKVDIKACMQAEPDLTKAEIEKAAEQFQVYDVDGSGGLDQNEITSALVQLGIESSEDQVEHYIRDFDADQNGSIDIIEFLGVIRKAKFDSEIETIAFEPDRSTKESKACIVM